MRQLTHLPLLTALALAAPSAHAQVDEKPTACGRMGEAARFAAFHDNYGLWNQMSNNGWAPRDERSLRGQVSVKYSLVNCPQRRHPRTRALKSAPDAAETAATDGTIQPLETANKRATFLQRLHSAEVFVSYTNRFDFYLGSRDSGPVINRLSNPGVHVRLPGRLFTGDKGDARGAWQLSLEHMSDGQVVEPVSNDRDRLLAQRAYERGDRHFFDTISRGTNYVALQGEWVWDIERRKGAVFDVRAKLKHYVTSDSAITWGPLANQGLQFANYERLKVRLGLFWPDVGRFELTTQLGDSGLRHASHTVSWQFDAHGYSSRLVVPFFVQAHFGPMNTLSNYTQRQNSIGVGLRLAY